ncbi:MAG: RHS repeat-associated core domain-containing protein [Leptospiraceae bacterium]|nr:RHS repeat-associated core domain-containing protein [Leptospiraceae bacterium]
MDTKDGKVKNKKLIGYKYDEKENKFTRTFGNGVVTELGFNPTSGHLTSSKLTTGTTKRIEENKKYSYDTSGNITKINDSANTWRSQTFSYDTYNRLTKSTGSYGEEEYTYTSNGNLTKKGKTTMGYSETDHAHAVSLVKTPYETHTYEYDESGYITKKDNDTFTHDDFGRLSSIVTGFGEEFNYFYDYKGRRSKKINRKKDETTYYFEDGLYEIHVAPNVAQRYTLYVKNGDELIAQWTRTDAVLENAESGFVSFANLENQQYLFVFLFLLLLIAWFGYAHQADKAWSFPERSVTLSLSKGLRARYIFALSLIGVILITCAKNKDAFPFAAIVSGITSETPSVNDASSQNPGDGGGGGTANAPVEGLYFFHTDHLDSVTMLTGTGGELLTGSSIGSGKSIVSYTPYGEIDRDHSGGPDIYRYKYTGQEEDKETGLYYYKARYYDSKIGRFLEPDTVMEVSSPFGANQYMYVEGNPVMYNDPTGHWKLNGKRSNFQRLSHKFGNLMKRAQKEIAYAQKMNKQAEQIQMFLTSPTGLIDAFTMFVIAKSIGRSSVRETIFGHKYTWNGNRDRFSNFFNESKKGSTFVKFYLATKVLSIALYRHLGIPLSKNDKNEDVAITDDKIWAFYNGILPNLRARPKSFADRLAMVHDDEVPGSEFNGSRDKHRSADAHYYKHWGDGLLTGRDGFWEQPLDSIFVGGGGSYLFLTHDVCVTRTTNDFARAICLGLLF